MPSRGPRAVPSRASVKRFETGVPTGRSHAGERALLVRRHLDERRPTRADSRDRPLEGGPQLVGALDALGVSAEGARNLCVTTAEPVRLVAGDRLGHPLAVAAHHAVVEQDREDRDPAADGRLEVHADHAEGGVAHDVDGKAVRTRELRPDREPEARTELRRLAPAEIPPLDGALVEGHDLIARMPG